MPRDSAKRWRPTRYDQLPPFCWRFEQLGLEFFDRVRVEPDDTVVLVALQPPVPPLLDGEEPV